jgi:hypothetical protein
VVDIILVPSAFLERKMRFNFLRPAILALLAASASAAIAQVEIPKHKVTGTVVDSAGSPVSGAVIATSWSTRGGSILTAPPGSPTSREDGTFEGDFQIYRFPTVVTVIHEGRRIGGCYTLTEEPTEGIRVKLQPLARLCFRPNFDGAYDGSLMVMLNKPDAGQVGYFTAEGPQTDILVPAGAHELMAYSLDTSMSNLEVTLPAGQRTEIYLGVKLSGLAKSYGKAALPLTFSEARGLSKDFQLSDLKGKWVLLEFWGFW